MKQIIILFFAIFFCMELFCQEIAISEKKTIFDITRMYDSIILDEEKPDNTTHLLYFKDMPTLSKTLEEDRIICKDFEVNIQECILKYGEKYRNEVVIFETANK